MIVLTAMALCSICNGQKRHRCMAGTDLTALPRSHEADIFFGISIGEFWSVSAGTSIRIPWTVEKGRAVHHDDLLLEDHGFRNMTEDLVSVRIGAQYWPKEVFNGPMLSFGLCTGHSMNIGCPIDIGYMCRISKDLWIAATYDIELTETIRKVSIKGKGICISIGYEF